MGAMSIAPSPLTTGVAPEREHDHAVAHPVLGQVSLRCIYVHMIEEIARHAGDADILREPTDGATGVA